MQCINTAQNHSHLVLIFFINVKEMVLTDTCDTEQNSPSQEAAEVLETVEITII
jgi:hypothetical protein